MVGKFADFLASPTDGSFNGACCTGAGVPGTGGEAGAVTGA